MKLVEELRGWSESAKRFAFAAELDAYAPTDNAQLAKTRAQLRTALELIHQARIVTKLLTAGGDVQLSASSTVRVRIAVSVTQNKHWRAWGAMGADDEVCLDRALEGLAEDAITHFVEADIPVPESNLIEGVIV